MKSQEYTTQCFLLVVSSRTSLCIQQHTLAVSVPTSTVNMTRFYFLYLSYSLLCMCVCIGACVWHKMLNNSKKLVRCGMQKHNARSKPTETETSLVWQTTSKMKSSRIKRRKIERWQLLCIATWDRPTSRLVFLDCNSGTAFGFGNRDCLSVQMFWRLVRIYQYCGHI